MKTVQQIDSTTQELDWIDIYVYDHQDLDQQLASVLT